MASKIVSNAILERFLISYENSGYGCAKLNLC